MALERTDEEVEHALDLGEFALYMRDGTVPVRVGRRTVQRLLQRQPDSVVTPSRNRQA
jgi:hypothetical protein